MKLFLSYASDDRQKVGPLLDGLHRLKHSVWFDQELSGGQQWWDTILERIRNSDAVVAAVSQAYQESVACTRELDYAIKVARPVLPVKIEAIRDELLLPQIVGLHFIDFIKKNPRAAYDLAGAFNELPPAPPLPDPLPEPPDVPISYLSGLSQRILSSERLPLEEQWSLVGQLKFGLTRPKERESVVELMGHFKARNDLYAAISQELDAITPADRPTAPPRTRRRAAESTKTATTQASETATTQALDQAPLSGLSQRILSPQPLTLNEQLSVVGRLELGLSRPTERDSVLELMGRLKARNDLFLAVSRQLDAMTLAARPSAPPRTPRRAAKSTNTGTTRVSDQTPRPAAAPTAPQSSPQTPRPAAVPATPQASSQTPRPAYTPPSAGSLPTMRPAFTRPSSGSVFARDSSQWLEEAGARYRAEQDAMAAARPGAPWFFSVPAWWVALVLAAILCVGAYGVAEWSFVWVLSSAHQDVQPVDTLAPLILAGLAWTATYSFVAALQYWHDPRKQAAPTIGKGLLGGWMMLDDWDGLGKVVGLLPAIPVGQVVVWLVGRSAAYGADVWLGSGHLWVHWLVLTLGTIVGITAYVLWSLDDVDVL